MRVPLLHIRTASDYNSRKAANLYFYAHNVRLFTAAILKIFFSLTFDIWSIEAEDNCLCTSEDGYRLLYCKAILFLTNSYFQCKSTRSGHWTSLNRKHLPCFCPLYIEHLVHRRWTLKFFKNKIDELNLLNRKFFK